jgi:zinc protease
MKRLLTALSLALPLAAAASVEVHETVLDNGLKVLVKPDRRAPIVTSQVWYKVGSSYEYGGLTGISHVLEHMMFKGTEKLEPGRVLPHHRRARRERERLHRARLHRLLPDPGQRPPAHRLRAGGRAHAQPRLPEEEFLKELEVVKEERRQRTEDDPQSLTFEQFNATAWEASPYRIPVIGWASDLESLKVDDLRYWYQKWYAPNNATLVVVGDVDPEEVIALAKEHFGPLKPEEVGSPKPRSEPPSAARSG